MQNMDSYLDLAACNLAEYHIPLTAVADAFKNLASSCTQTIHLQAANAGGHKFNALVGQILGGAKATESNEKFASIPQKCMVVISSSPSSSEATAAACILKHKIQDYTLQLTGENCCL